MRFHFYYGNLVEKDFRIVNAPLQAVGYLKGVISSIFMK
jgi:hypothetical protein